MNFYVSSCSEQNLELGPWGLKGVGFVRDTAGFESTKASGRSDKVQV